MDGNKVDAIFEELVQICSQYKEEVPGRRRAWPKAIKERVLQLRKLGVSGAKIADRIAITYRTTISWQPRTESNFLSVSVDEPRRLKTTAVAAFQFVHMNICWSSSGNAASKKS